MPPPALLEVAEIQRRLQKIFPEGAANRQYCTRELAAKTVFTMLYIGATEGTGRWLSPKQVYHMSDRQAALTNSADRDSYAVNSVRPGFRSRFRRWYADNSREPIRDETLRGGLVSNGAVKTRSGVPTTSPKGRFALEGEFAALFDPTLRGEELDRRIADWHKTHLSASALARIQIIQHGATAAKDKIIVSLPNGETRAMSPGVSSVIAKEVAEQFAIRFLQQPAVIWISESGKKVVQRDDQLAQAIGLRIDPSTALPDMILADVSKPEVFVIFVEVVATDGPVTEARKRQLLRIATDANFDEGRILFVTAFMDRDSEVFRRCFPQVAWGSFVWCASEPEHVIALDGPDAVRVLTNSILWPT